MVWNLNTITTIYFHWWEIWERLSLLLRLCHLKTRLQPHLPRDHTHQGELVRLSSRPQDLSTTCYVSIWRSVRLLIENGPTKAMAEAIWLWWQSLGSHTQSYMKYSVCDTQLPQCWAALHRTWVPRVELYWRAPWKMLAVLSSLVQCTQGGCRLGRIKHERLPGQWTQMSSSHSFG